MRRRQQSRAPRFIIETPMRYRKTGQKVWSEGSTITISRTGVLFRATNALEPETTIEMRILFPAEDPPANVVCWGRVVRKELPHPPDPRPAVAAAIYRYSLTRKESEAS